MLKVELRHLSLAMICSALLIGCSSVRNSETGPSRTQTIDLEYGTVELPDNFIHFQGRGYDSLGGDFTRTDGRFRINYDIGAMAGDYTSQKFVGVLSSNSMTVGKLTAIIVVHGFADARQAVVSFPPLAVNFFAVINDDSQLETLKKIVATYKRKLGNDTK